MFNPEEAIAQWRRQMRAAGIRNSRSLDELEGHLREDLRVLKLRGTPDEQAFQLAVARLGNHGSVSVEFGKVHGTWGFPLITGLMLWAIMAAWLAMTMAKEWLAGKVSLLLSAHIFTLTTGYGAALLSGAFGIYWLTREFFRPLSAAGQQSLSRAGGIFSYLALALVAIGLFLGGVWSRLQLGHYGVSDPRAIGTLGVLIWLVALCLVVRFYQPNGHTMLLLCMVSNIVITLAWFGPQVILNNLHDAAASGPLGILLGVHLIFLAIGIVRHPQISRFLNVRAAN